MAIFLPEAYALGLLAQLQRQRADLRRDLDGAAQRAERLQQPLAAAIAQLAAASDAEQQRRARAHRAATAVADENAKVAGLTREMAALRRRVEQLGLSLQQAGEEEVQLALRQQRGALLAQVANRKVRLEAAMAVAGAARQTVVDARRDAAPFADRLGALQLEVARLGAELPRPQSLMRLAEVEMAQAHAQFVLDQAPQPFWAAAFAVADQVLQVHVDLHAQRLPGETHGEVQGGRAHATVAALCARVAGGRLAEAAELFAAATRPQWFFHHIFNVFLVWCFGLWVRGERQRLAELLALHEYAQGLRGAYARAFLALLHGDAARFARALRQQIQADWDAWRKLPQKGLGLVNLPALALCRLAEQEGLAPAAADWGPTVPAALRAAPPAGQR